MKRNEVDRETFEKTQFSSIQKAINREEVAAKEKHIRTAILGTYQEKGAKIFWHVVRSLQLSTNAITCWKFCHVLHKLLRDGHENTLADSHRYKQQITDLGNIWTHATTAYGSIIPKYSQFLTSRMKFTIKYKEFSGNLSIDPEVLEQIGNNDINSYFELCVDVMDCLECLMNLQEGIFRTLDVSRAVSMTGPGQCRLAPCIPVILDSSQLYDYALRVMFKLHSTLPADTLTGHRDRFSVLFSKLKSFFYQCSNMQYFKRLIQIPLLPDEAPDFLIKSSERHQHEPAVMIEEELQREPSPEPLIEPQPFNTDFDAVFGASQAMSDFLFQQQPDARDLLISQLRAEIEELKREIERLIANHGIEIRNLLDQIDRLERELELHKNAESVNQQKVNNLQRQLVEARAHFDNASKKLTAVGEVEKRASANEDLYKRMKDKYMNLVKDHASLMRKSTDVQKHSETLQMSAKDYAEKQMQLTVDHENLQRLLADKEKEYESAMRLKREESERIFLLTIGATEKVIQDAIDDMVDPLNAQSTCSAASLIKTVNAALESLDSSHSAVESYFKGNDTVAANQTLPLFGHSIAQTLLNGIATCHLVSDEDVKNLNAACHSLGSESLSYLENLRKFVNNPAFDVSPTKIRDDLQTILSAATDLLPRMKDITSGDLQDVVEQEMSSTTNAIESAASRIEEMLRQARERDTGLNLEVNERILDSCTELMLAIKALIMSSKDLQKEIVNDGRGGSSIKEFYMKNSRWTEGLISAAKAVGFGATLLTDAADQAVTGDGKFEEIIVCSHEIAASTAQLVAASRVKANKMSVKLPKLQKASKDVNAAAGKVVASTNSGRKQIDESVDFMTTDLSKYTLTQIKRKEMDSQVRLLELEQLIQQERVKLGKFRQQHYVLAGVDESENEPDSNSGDTSNNTNDNVAKEAVNSTQRVKPPLPIKPSWT